MCAHVAHLHALEEAVRAEDVEVVGRSQRKRANEVRHGHHGLAERLRKSPGGREEEGRGADKHRRVYTVTHPFFFCCRPIVSEQPSSHGKCVFRVPSLGRLILPPLARRLRVRNPDREVNVKKQILQRGVCCSTPSVYPAKSWIDAVGMLAIAVQTAAEPAVESITHMDTPHRYRPHPVPRETSMRERVSNRNRRKRSTFNSSLGLDRL